MRLVHGHIAGIPESQDLMELKKCLSFNPAISVSDLLITNLERVEPYRSPPPGFPRLVKISFLTSVQVPTQIFVKDTSVALDIRLCPVTPTRCFNCQGHIASRALVLLHVAAAPDLTAREGAPTKYVGAPTVAARTPHPTRGCPSYQRAVHLATFANFYGVTWSEEESRLFVHDSHSVGARNTITTTGSTLSPKHASTGIISSQTGRTCPIVEGLVGKSTPPQPINMEPPPAQRRPPVATRGSSPSTLLSDGASDTTCSGTTLSDNSMFDVTGHDSLVSVHSSILGNLTISGVCEREEEPRVSV
ncbi:hypothetical protein DPMN_159323 [Dreissena polymorpha]|uniref:Uncharacterized protein n=1 Tax=Dreissena polymorpha TaxID=45954 RepID=A0A9D4EKU5_DREPO|nr:hypothetical protein DPMN_159323 [Dreissena polymorpha]